MPETVIKGVSPGLQVEVVGMYICIFSLWLFAADDHNYVILRGDRIPHYTLGKRSG